MFSFKAFSVRSALLVLLATMMLLFPLQGLAAPAKTAKESFVISGKSVSLKNATIAKNGVVFAPAKELFEKLGFKAKWDAKNKQLTLTKKGQTVLLRDFQKVIRVNGKNFRLDQLNSISNGMLYVPLQTALEAVGYQVKVDSKNKKYSIGTKKNVVPSKGFFWEASKDGHLIYLLGSIHTGTEQLYPLLPSIETAFQNSTKLAVEADLLNMNQVRLQQMVLKKAVYSDGKTIKDHIPAEVYEQLVAKLEAAQLPVEQLSVFKPWYMAILLGQLQQQQLYPQAKADLGIDMHFLKAANERELPIAELEGAELQFNMFDNLSAEMELLFLKSALEDPPADMNPYAFMMSGWKKGDDNMLLSIMDQLNTSEESKQFSKILLDIRNEGMLQKIEGYFAERDQVYFVVAGAAHMLGENGLVEMMQRQGYELTRIMD